MARQPRFFVPGEVLHVIQRGNNREPIFAGEADYRFFLDCLVQASRLHGVLIEKIGSGSHFHLKSGPDPIHNAGSSSRLGPRGKPQNQRGQARIVRA